MSCWERGREATRFKLSLIIFAVWHENDVREATRFKLSLIIFSKRWPGAAQSDVCFTPDSVQIADIARGPSWATSGLRKLRNRGQWEAA